MFILKSKRREIWGEKKEINVTPFEQLSVEERRPSILPERLLRALLIQAFYWVRNGAPAQQGQPKGTDSPGRQAP